MAGFVATYYPGVTRIGDEHVVTANAGSVLAGVDLALQSSLAEFVGTNGRLLTGN